MQAKTAIMMKVMLNGFHNGSPDSILECLPEEEAKEVLNQAITSENPLPALTQPLDKIANVHPSWLIPVLEQFPVDVQAVVASVLPQPHRMRVWSALKLNQTPQELSEPVRVFLTDALYWKIPGAKESLPPEYLPRTPITRLADWSPEEIEELINFLGLHDLAEELRSVVHQQQLQAVYKALTPREQQYLIHCMRNKGRIKTTPLGLEKWSKLRLMLQTKGRTRLAKALSGEHPDVMWTISHRMEREYGMALMKEHSKTPIPNITQILGQQVLEIMNILKKKSKS